VKDRKRRELLGRDIFGTIRPWGKLHGLSCFDVLIMGVEEGQEGWPMARQEPAATVGVQGRST